MRTKLILAIVCFNLFGAVASAADAPAPLRRQINIPAQQLDMALEALAKDRNLQVLYRSEVVGKLRSQPVSGQLTFDEALGLLLRNTGLTSRYVDAKTVTIVPAGENAGNGGRGLQTTSRNDGDAASLVLARSAAEKAKADDGVEEMLVEGERERSVPFSTANLDLTRTEDDALPFTVFTARDVELSGAADLLEFLQTRLPQNFNSAVPNENVTTFTNGTAPPQSQVDLRGWGATETVFLLNGRRMPAEYLNTGTDATNATPNLQRIPIGSIARIEILSSAGSAIYGTSATGGVINIITRQDFRGGQFAVNYETPADTHAPRRSVDISYGLPIKWGMGLRLVAGHSDTQPVPVRTRSAVTIERWRRLVMERQPLRLLSPTNNPPMGATPNIRAASTAPGANLFSGLTGTQAAAFTSVPDGYTGGGGLNVFSPGVYNLQLADSVGGSLYAKDYKIGNSLDSNSIAVGLDRNFGSRWRWSVDYRYGISASEGVPQNNAALSLTGSVDSNPGVNSKPLVVADAPINPFGQDVVVLLVDPRMQRPELRSEGKNRMQTLSSTLRGTFGAWSGFIDASYSQQRGSSLSENYIEPFGGWNNAFMTGAYNPFVDVRVVAPAAQSFYENYILDHSISAGSSRSYQSAAKISGPILGLPAGALQLTTGVDWTSVDRDMSYSFSQLQDSQTRLPRPFAGDTYTDSGNDQKTRQWTAYSYAAYAEASIPLLAPRQQVPLARRLELFGSGRLDSSVRDGYRCCVAGDYTPFRYTNRTHVSALGLRYEATEALALRMSQSIGFKPPNISQTTPSDPSPANNLIMVNDPRRATGTIPQPVTLNGTQRITGGNPDLIPETTNSSNFGMVFMPSWGRGLRVSMDYLESIRDDAITTITAQNMVDFEADFPGRVQRGAPDGHPSGVGPIVFLDYRSINLRQIASRSVDFSLDQQIADVFGGRLSLAASATRNLSFKVQTTNTTPAVEQIRSLTTTFARQIAWNANGQVGWEGNRWGFGWNVRFFDYILVAVNDRLLQGGDRAPWTLNHDLNISYRAPRAASLNGMQWLLSGTSITFGVKNVFDRAPRFWANSTDAGVAPYDSIFGRSVWLQMRKSFE